jgi:hypothetical protein
VRSRPDLTFFRAFAALSRNITEFTAVLGRSRRKHRAEGCGLRIMIRLTRFVVGETLIFVGQDADDLTSWHER